MGDDSGAMGLLIGAAIIPAIMAWPIVAAIIEYGLILNAIYEHNGSKECKYTPNYVPYILGTIANVAVTYCWFVYIMPHI